MRLARFVTILKWLLGIRICLEMRKCLDINGCYAGVQSTVARECQILIQMHAEKYRTKQVQTQRASSLILITISYEIR
jgi:hypothetical protein